MGFGGSRRERVEGVWVSGCSVEGQYGFKHGVLQHYCGSNDAADAAAVVVVMIGMVFPAIMTARTSTNSVACWCLWQLVFRCRRNSLRIGGFVHACSTQDPARVKTFRGFRGQLVNQGSLAQEIQKRPCAGPGPGQHLHRFLEPARLEEFQEKG